MGFDLSTLGVKKNIPSVNFVDYTGIIAAPPKFGKSTIATKFPNPIILPFEKGYKGLVANVFEGLNTWEDFIKWIDEVEKHRPEIGNAIQTIVFDTINSAYEMLEPYTLKYCSKIDGTKYRTVADMQGANSNYWIERDKLLKKQLNRLANLGFAMFFITHLEVKTIKPKKGEPYDEYSDTMERRCREVIVPFVDFIITGENRRVEEDGVTKKKRVLITSSNDMTTAGARVYLSEDIVFETEDEAIEKYQAAFEKQARIKLEEAGITKKFETIQKEQAKEKEQKVKEYLEKKNEVPFDDMMDIVKKGYKENEEIKEELKKYIKERGYKSLSEFNKDRDMTKIKELHSKLV